MSAQRNRRITRQKNCGKGARLLIVFFLRLRKNEQTHCSVEKVIAAEGKRWVGVLIDEPWRLHSLMRHREYPYQEKTKVCYCDRGE